MTFLDWIYCAAIVYVILIITAVIYWYAKDDNTFIEIAVCWPFYAGACVILAPAMLYEKIANGDFIDSSHHNNAVDLSIPTDPPLVGYEWKMVKIKNTKKKKYRK